MKIDQILSDFKKMDLDQQTMILLFTDYKAFWFSLIEYYKGDRVKIIEVIGEFDIEKLKIWNTHKDIFFKEYPVLTRKIKNLFIGKLL